MPYSKHGFRYNKGYWIRWVGFYIDIDLIIYMMISKFNNCFKFIFRGNARWICKTLEFMAIGKYNIIGEVDMRRFEILSVYNGFLLYNFFPCLFNYNNESVNLSVNKSLYLYHSNYVYFARGVRSNLSGFVIQSGLKAWHPKYVKNYNYRRNCVFNVAFLDKNIINISKNISFFNCYNKHYVFLKSVDLLLQYENSMVFVVAFWSFQRYYLLYEGIRFHCLLKRKIQHRRFRELRLLRFFFSSLVTLSYNLMSIYSKSFRTFYYLVNLRFFKSSLLNSTNFSNSIMSFKCSYFYLYNFNNDGVKKRNIFSSKYLFNLMYNFDENLHLSYNRTNNYYLHSNYFLFNDIFSYKGGLLGGALALDYGLSWMMIFKMADFKNYLNYFISNYCLLKLKLFNFMNYLLDVNVVVAFLYDDLYYFYKDLIFTESIFKLWKWYTFFDGCDFHVNWGWLGHIKLMKRDKVRKKLRKTCYKDITINSIDELRVKLKVFETDLELLFRPAIWVWRHLESLY